MGPANPASLPESAKPRPSKTNHGTTRAAAPASVSGSGGPAVRPPRSSYRGKKATALPGPPDEPPILSGKKTKKAPRVGSWSRFVRIST